MNQSIPYLNDKATPHPFKKVQDKSLERGHLPCQRCWYLLLCVAEAARSLSDPDWLHGAEERIRPSVGCVTWGNSQGVRRSESTLQNPLRRERRDRTSTSFSVSDWYNVSCKLFWSTLISVCHSNRTMIYLSSRVHNSTIAQQQLNDLVVALIDSMMKRRIILLR